MYGFVSTLLASATVAASTIAPARGVLLWNDLYAGMSKKEVKQLYPKFRTNFALDCPVQVLSMYQSGGLVSVILVSKGNHLARYVKIAADLRRQLGEPASQQRRQATTPLVTANSVSYREVQLRDSVWQRGDKTTRLAL